MIQLSINALRLSAIFMSCLLATASFAANTDGASMIQTAELEGTQYRVVLSPRSTAIVSSRVSSIVKEIPKELGQSFAKGDALILLDDTVFMANQQKANSVLERAQAQLSAKQELYHDNVASLLELKDAEAQTVSSQADLALANQQLEACHVGAPYCGRVANVFVNAYEMVQPGQQLIEIVDDTVLLAKMLLPSSEYNRLKLGDEIQIYVQETGSHISAKISHIGASIDPASSMMKVYAEVINNNNLLRSGMVGMTQLDQNFINQSTVDNQNATPSVNVK